MPTVGERAHHPLVGTRTSVRNSARRPGTWAPTASSDAVARSMNIAPPPRCVARCDTVPAAASSSTSLRTDWNEPSTTSGESQSQNRRRRRRSPVATSRVITSSSATSSPVQHHRFDDVEGCGRASWSRGRALGDRDTDRFGVNPIRATSSPIFSAIAWPIRVASAVVGSPGPRRRCPRVRRPAREEVAGQRHPGQLPVLHIDVDDHELATGNLVFTTHERSVSVSATGRWRGNRRHLRCDRRRRRRVTRGGLSASHLRAAGCRRPGPLPLLCVDHRAALVGVVVRTLHDGAGRRPRWLSRPHRRRRS